MNDSSLYEVGLVLSITVFLTLLIFICIDMKYTEFDNIKRN